MWSWTTDQVPERCGRSPVMFTQVRPRSSLRMTQGRKSPFCQLLNVANTTSASRTEANASVT